MVTFYGCILVFLFWVIKAVKKPVGIYTSSNLLFINLGCSRSDKNEWLPLPK